MNEAAHRVGRARITCIRETVLDGFTPEGLFPNWDARVPTDHPDHLPVATMDACRRHLLLGVHSWLVQVDGRTILIDTGAGNGKRRPHAADFDGLDTLYLANLRAAGIAPEDVDLVLLTHLHVDHVGWNTRLEGGRWVPTFPNARHVFSRAEHAFFTDPANLTDATRTSFAVQQDSVDPIIAAGLADPIVVDGSSPVEGFTFHPTPGHSPDHASIGFESDGDIALFAGDVFHHPVEVFRPELMTLFDRDISRVRASRDWALAYAADTGATVFSSHFTASSAGRVTREGGGYRWDFV